LSRPIDGAAVIRRTFGIYAAHAVFLLPASAIVVAMAGGLQALGVSVSGVLAVLEIVVVVLITAMFVGAVVALVADVCNGSPEVSASRRLRAVKPVLGKLILVGIAASIAIMLCFSLGPIVFILVLLGAAFAIPLGGVPLGVGVGLGVGVVFGSAILLAPGLYLVTRWSVAAPAVVLERPSGLGALGRSADLVWGNRWRVFGLVLLLLILAGVLSGTIALLAGFAGADARNIAVALVDIVIAPIPVIFSTVLYVELLGAAALSDPSF
jgi:hypothetical protein